MTSTKNGQFFDPPTPPVHKRPFLRNPLPFANCGRPNFYELDPPLPPLHPTQLKISDIISKKHAHNKFLETSFLGKKLSQKKQQLRITNTLNFKSLNLKIFKQIF